MFEIITKTITALGSLATFGAFIFLLRRDKNKQEQIDKINDLVSIFSTQNELIAQQVIILRDNLIMQNKDQKTLLKIHDLEAKRLKLRSKPDLQKSQTGISGSDGTLEIQLINKGETAIIEDIKYFTEDINFINIKNLPFKLQKGNFIKIKGTTKCKKHIKICEYEMDICFTDSIKNKYISRLKGKGKDVKIFEAKEFKDIN